MHDPGIGGGGRDFPAGGPETEERLPGLRPSGRGGKGDRKRRADLPPVAPPPVPGKAATYGQGAWWSAEVCLRATVNAHHALAPGKLLFEAGLDEGADVGESVFDHLRSEDDPGDPGVLQRLRCDVQQSARLRR